MKLLLIIFVYLLTTFIEGVPNDYEQWLQPRGLSDIPTGIVNWFYNWETENVNKESNTSSSSHQQHSSTLNSHKSEIDPVSKEESNEKPEPVKNFAEKLKQTNPPDELKLDESEHINDDDIKVVPLDGVEPGAEAEPIENLIENLKKEQAEEKNDEEKKSIMTLLTKLNETMKQSSSKIAKVFINKAWHIFDIGALGSTRRTRSMDEVGSLVMFYNVLLGLLSQILSGLHLGGINNYLGIEHSQNNNAQQGLLELLFPSYGSSVNQKLLGGIAGYPGKKHNSSNKLVIVSIDDENEKANHLFHGKTPEEILSKIKLYLDNDDLDITKKLYIVLKLGDLFERLSGDKDETALKLLTLIFQIGEDSRFDELFRLIGSREDPEFKHVWNLFKKKPKLNEKYINIIRNLPREKIKEHPSRDCFIINPEKYIVKNGSKSDYNSDDSDDEDEQKHTGKTNMDVKTYVIRTGARGVNSKDDYYICCIDDDDEKKADRIFNDKTTDEIIIKIRKYLERKDDKKDADNEDDSDPEYKWYIILKLYKMLKDIEDNDKKGEKDKEDKDKIITLIILIGKDPKFKKLVDGVESKKAPRLREMKKLLKNEPRDPEEISPKKTESEAKVEPPNSSVADTLPKKDLKDEKEVKTETPQPHVDGSPQKQDVAQAIPPQHVDTTTKLPDNSDSNEAFWRGKLQTIEILMKNPTSRWNVINYLDTYYMNGNIHPKVKPQFDEICRKIGQDPQYDDTFRGITRDNYPQVTQRVFNLFGKKMNNPAVVKNESETSSQSSTSNHQPFGKTTYSEYYRYSSYKTQPDYFWLDTLDKPEDDDTLAQLPLVKKLDTLIDYFSLVYMKPIVSSQNRQELKKNVDTYLERNRKDFKNLENVLIPQINGKEDFFIDMLWKFRSYILKDNYTYNFNKSSLPKCGHRYYTARAYFFLIFPSEKINYSAPYNPKLLEFEHWS